MKYIGKKEQLADIFTKLLPRETFEYLREKLGVILSPNWIHLSSTTLQYEKGGMAEVPFAIDAKGGEKVEQGRLKKHELRGSFVDKKSSFEGGACGQVCVGVSWCPLRSPWGLSKFQCLRRPFDLVQAQVQSPWSPWDISKSPVECSSNPKWVEKVASVQITPSVVFLCAIKFLVP